MTNFCNKNIFSRPCQIKTNRRMENQFKLFTTYITGTYFFVLSISGQSSLREKVWAEGYKYDEMWG